jgi:hypothetical protein
MRIAFSRTLEDIPHRKGSEEDGLFSIEIELPDENTS